MSWWLVILICSIFQLRRWYNAAKTNAPTAPTAADSVGVAMPEKIEPSTATMSEIGGTMALATLKYFSALPKLHLLLLKIGAACGNATRNQH
jgi:hypothetical protein